MKPTIANDRTLRAHMSRRALPFLVSSLIGVVGLALALVSAARGADADLWDAWREIGGGMFTAAIIGMVLHWWSELANTRRDQHDEKLATDALRHTLRVALVMADDLTGKQLVEQDLRGIALVGRDLSGAIMVGADLSGANLGGCTMRTVLLSDARLTGASLHNANLTGSNLAGANLVGANLTGANLVGVNLTGADLTGANLRCAAPHPQRAAVYEPA